MTKTEEMISLSEEIKKLRCPDCGNTYTPGAKTCRSCGKTLPQPATNGPEDPDSLEGMPEKDWRDFIGKNASFYLDTFKKHKDKNFFLSVNPGAFIFGFVWFVYRKMFKQAFLLYLLSILLSALFVLVGTLIQIPIVTAAKEEYRPYTVYKTFDGERTEEYPEYNSAKKREIEGAYSSYKAAQSNASTISTVLSRVGSFATSLLISFSANWLYKEHILNHTTRRKGYVAKNGKGGTSLGAALVTAIFGEFIMAYLLAGLSLFLLFIMSGS